MIITLLILLGFYRKEDSANLNRISKADSTELNANNSLDLFKDQATQTEDIPSLIETKGKSTFKQQKDVITFKIIPEESESASLTTFTEAESDDIDLCNSIIPDARINALYEKYLEKF